MIYLGNFRRVNPLSVRPVSALRMRLCLMRRWYFLVGDGLEPWMRNGVGHLV